MSDNEYSDEEHGFDDDCQEGGVDDDDWQEGGVDDDDWQEGEVDDDDSDKEDIEQDTGEDERGEADDDRDEEKRSHSCHSYPQYPRYPAYPPYPPCCGSKAGGGGENVEAKVSMKMSNMGLNEKVEEKEGTTEQQKQ